jgi:hypothetical protein
MDFKRMPECAMRIGLGGPIPIKFIGTVNGHLRMHIFGHEKCTGF